eukprot:04595.XXX_108212_108313_1 [CDS] Oithona nana genome sequencing.
MTLILPAGMTSHSFSKVVWMDSVNMAALLYSPI